MNSEKLVAYHGRPELKIRFTERVRSHRVAGRLRQGHVYWKDNCGCAIGCTVHGFHALYPSELGIPVVVAFVEERIFELLPTAEAMLWPEMFLEAITPGADHLDQVWPNLAAWLLDDPEHGVVRYASCKESEEVIRKAAELYRSRVSCRETWSAVFRQTLAIRRSTVESAAYALSAVSSASAFASRHARTMSVDFAIRAAADQDRACLAFRDKVLELLGGKLDACIVN